jgi:hypothetical protein
MRQRANGSNQAILRFVLVRKRLNVTGPDAVRILL